MSRIGHRVLGALGLGVPVAFLGAFFVGPLLLLFWVSIHTPSTTDFYGPSLTADNYIRLASDPFYWTILGRTLWAGLVVVGSCLLVGYPMALALVALPRRWGAILTAAILFPLMLSNVIRAYGWIAIMGRRGVANTVLLESGAIERPLAMLYTFEAVTVALMTILLPYMVVSIANALRAIDPRYVEAAQSLGAGPLRTFFRITFPLSSPGVASGLVIVFLLMLSAYVTINLVGGARLKLLVNLVFDASVAFEWPRAAALSFVLLAAGLLGAALIFALLRPNRVQGRA